MKSRIFAMLLILCLLLCGCSKIKVGSGNPGAEPALEDRPAAASTLQAPISQPEYVEYQNLFFNKQAEQFVGQHVTKVGIFIIMHDNWSNKDRYYVWGYYDHTKCCDWQWEFVPNHPNDLPRAGSLVKMTGTLEYNEAALDKYWYKDAVVETVTRYEGETADVDLTVMDGTLERVQLLNLLHAPDLYEGKTVRIYGRVMTPNTIQHPYYDNVWKLDFTTGQEVPAIGTMVVVTGTWQSSTLVKAQVTATGGY